MDCLYCDMTCWRRDNSLLLLLFVDCGDDAVAVVAAAPFVV